MIRARGRLALPALLLAALAVLFAVLLVVPWAAQAQTVPTLQVEDVSASEGAGDLEFTVSLADGATATEAVTVDYATSDGDALAGNDYTGTRGTLTIPTGASSGVISVPVNNDNVPEVRRDPHPHPEQPLQRGAARRRELRCRNRDHPRRRADPGHHHGPPGRGVRRADDRLRHHPDRLCRESNYS